MGSSEWVLPCSPGSDSTAATRPVGAGCRRAAEDASDGTADIAGRWDNLSCCTTTDKEQANKHYLTVLLTVYYYSVTYIYC